MNNVDPALQTKYIPASGVCCLSGCDDKIMTSFALPSEAWMSEHGVTEIDAEVNTTTAVFLAPDLTPTRWQLLRFLLIVIVSLLSNLLIVVTIKRSPRLQTMLYYYLSSLAFMDIIDSLLVMPVAFARNLLSKFISSNTLGHSSFTEVCLLVMPLTFARNSSVSLFFQKHSGTQVSQKSVFLSCLWPLPETIQ